MSTASGLDLARLQIVFDTTTAPTAISAMQQVASQSRTVGQAIDQQTVKQRENTKAALETARALEQLGVAHAAAASGYKRGTNDGAAYARSVMDIKRALDEEAKAMAMVASGQQQRAAAISRLMMQARTDYQAGSTSAKQYADSLAKLQTEMNKIAGTQAAMVSSGKEAASNMALFSGAVGGLVGVLGFQALNGLTQFAGFITSLPGDLAHAGDEMERLNARLTFAYRGSADAARRAHQDIVKIARDTAMPYSMVAQGYGDLAIAGRGPGLSRQQIGGLASAFPMLAQMTGADTASTGRAQWQFQQALALGRLTSQDYRFMSTNMPALDDALAAGMGVDVNTIPGRVSRGEISAERMVDAMIRGVEVLRESAGGLPETMERARGRIQTEWELLLINMEERIKSSEFYQGFMNWYGQGLRNSGDLLSNDPQAQLDANRRLLQNEWFGPNRAWYESEIRRLEPIAAAAANDPAVRVAELTDAARTRATDRRGAIGRASQAADSIFTLDLQRADMGNTIQQLRDGLAAAGAPMTASDLSALRAENRRMQARQEELAAQGMGDSPEYRRLTTSRQANNSAISSGMLLPPEEAQRLQMALAGATAQLERMVSVMDRRRIDADNAEADLANFGPGGGFDLAQAARALMAQSASQGIYVDDVAARNMVAREQRIGIDRDIANRVAGNSDRQIIVDAAGLNAASRRRASLDAEMSGWRRDNPAATDTQAAAFRKQRQIEFRQGDEQALAERERADRERLAAMQAQLQMGIQLGQQGRIALAQAERERELRLQFPEITNEIVRAERERVAENIRIAEQLDLQTQQLGRLQDSAETAGAALGDALSNGVVAGLRGSQDAWEAALNTLARSGERILGNLLDNLTAPWERRLTEMASGGLGRIFGANDNSADKAVNALTDAASKAGETLSASMIPAIAETVTKTALSNSATATEVGMKAKSTVALTAFSAAVAQATVALQTMSGGAGGDVASQILSSLTGQSPIPKFANGVTGFSGGWAIVGDAGPELIKLPQGSNVYSNDKSKSLTGGSNVSIAVFDQRGASAAPVEQRESKGPNGERQIELYIKDKVVETTQSEEFAGAMRSGYGATRVVRRT